MNVFVAGSGKLGSSILSLDLSLDACVVSSWDQCISTTEKSILVHAGSGRQLDECLEFCERSGSVFIELSTGLKTEYLEPNFTLIVCPNSSILVLKALNLIKSFGHYFHGCDVSITESHQSTKTSEPGTAFNFARSLGLAVENITSIRDPQVQMKNIGIPTEFLDKHAFHKIQIKDGSDSLTIETKVLGHDSYSSGVRKIISAILNNNLEKRRYSILELIDGNMLYSHKCGDL